MKKCEEKKRANRDRSPRVAPSKNDSNEEGGWEFIGRKDKGEG